MKLNSRIWIKMESKGKPKDTKIMQATVYESVMHLAAWLKDIYMGHKIVITIGRTQADLEESTRNAEVKDMLAELDTMLAEGPIPDFKRIPKDPRGCEQCGADAVTELDGEWLCQTHANAWVRAEGVSANESESG